MFTQSQEQNYAYFKEHLADWLADPLKSGKFAVIHDQTLRNTFDTFDAAMKYAVGHFPGDYVIQPIIDESKIVNFVRAAVI